METELFFGPKFEENTSQTANSARYTETCPLRMCWFPQLKDWGRVGSSTKEVFFSCRKFIGLAEKLKSNKLFVFFSLDVPSTFLCSLDFLQSFAQHSHSIAQEPQIHHCRSRSSTSAWHLLPASLGAQIQIPWSPWSPWSPATCYPRVLGSSARNCIRGKASYQAKDAGWQGCRVAVRSATSENHKIFQETSNKTSNNKCQNQNPPICWFQTGLSSCHDDMAWHGVSKIAPEGARTPLGSGESAGFTAA